MDYHDDTGSRVALSGTRFVSLMARYNARREASGLVEFDRNVERLREASVNRSRE